MSNEFPAENGPATEHEQSPLAQKHVTGDFDTLKERVSDDIAQIDKVALEQKDAALDKAAAIASGQAHSAARQVMGVALALQKVGAELEDTGQGRVGQLSRELGDTVSAFAKDIEGRDVGEIAKMAEKFGRDQPLAFLGVAALAGLAASRFLTSSAKRLPKDAEPRDDQAKNQAKVTGGFSHG